MCLLHLRYQQLPLNLGIPALEHPFVTLRLGVLCRGLALEKTFAFPISSILGGVGEPIGTVGTACHPRLLLSDELPVSSAALYNLESSLVSKDLRNTILENVPPKHRIVLHVFHLSVHLLIVEFNDRTVFACARDNAHFRCVDVVGSACLPLLLGGLNNYCSHYILEFYTIE